MAAAVTTTLTLFAAGACYFDLRQRRVPNPLIAFFLVSGCIILACSGLGSLGCGLLGMSLGFAVLLPAFFLHMVGGGDVKSLAVIGLLTGPSLLWPVFFLAASAAGFAGAILLARRLLRRRRGRVRYASAGSPTIPYAAFLSLSAVLCVLVL